jgi:hypothetical protein
MTSQGFGYDIREKKMPNRNGFLSMLKQEKHNWLTLVRKRFDSIEKYYNDQVSLQETFSKSGAGVVNTRVDKESYHETELLGILNQGKSPDSASEKGVVEKQMFQKREKNIYLVILPFLLPFCPAEQWLLKRR